MYHHHRNVWKRLSDTGLHDPIQYRLHGRMGCRWFHRTFTLWCWMALCRRKFRMERRCCRPKLQRHVSWRFECRACVHPSTKWSYILLSYSVFKGWTGLYVQLFLFQNVWQGKPSYHICYQYRSRWFRYNHSFPQSRCKKMDSLYEPQVFIHRSRRRQILPHMANRT